jgi:hypothetical protein
MSNLSAKYDPTATYPQITGDITTVEQTVLYVDADIMPSNLLKLSTQTSSFRDAFIVVVLASGQAETCAKTFAKCLSTIEHVTTAEDRALCELTATMAYMADDMNLAKEALLRVPSQLVTSYIKTLYQAIALRKWNAETFKQAIANTTDNALNMWRVEKSSLNL